MRFQGQLPCEQLRYSPPSSGTTSSIAIRQQPAIYSRIITTFPTQRIRRNLATLLANQIRETELPVRCRAAPDHKKAGISPACAIVSRFCLTHTC